MNTTFDILVIALSSLLGIFLILSIITTIFVIKLIKSIRRVVNKGEQVIDSAEAAAEMFKKVGTPLSALKTVMSIVETVTKHKK